jgi:hypothetical protein
MTRSNIFFPGIVLGEDSDSLKELARINYEEDDFIIFFIIF